MLSFLYILVLTMQEISAEYPELDFSKKKQYNLSTHNFEEFS